VTNSYLHLEFLHSVSISSLIGNLLVYIRYWARGWIHSLVTLECLNWSSQNLAYISCHLKSILHESVIPTLEPLILLYYLSARMNRHKIWYTWHGPQSHPTLYCSLWNCSSNNLNTIWMSELTIMKLDTKPKAYRIHLILHLTNTSLLQYQHTGCSNASCGSHNIDLIPPTLSLSLHWYNMHECLLADLL
jgi:hypothetical protein